LALKAGGVRDPYCMHVLAGACIAALAGAGARRRLLSRGGDGLGPAWFAALHVGERAAWLGVAAVLCCALLTYVEVVVVAGVQLDHAPPPPPLTPLAAPPPGVLGRRMMALM